MDIYINLCILFAASAVIERLLPIKIRKCLFVINGFILLVIVGGRSCGTDYWLYKTIIEYGRETEWPLLFTLMVKYLPFQLVVFIVSLFTIVPFYLLICKSTHCFYNFAAAFFFTEYFFMTLMQQSRQGVALACIAWSLYFVQSQKIKAVITVFLGATIHIVGYFGFIPLFLKKGFYNLKTYAIAYGTSLLIGGLILNIILQNVGLLGIPILTNKFFGYAERTANLGASVSLVNFKFILIFLLVYYCYSKRGVLKNNMLPYLCNVLILGICFFTLFHPIVDLAVRGSRCFITLYFIVVLLLLEEKGILKLHRILIYWFAILYCIYLMTQNMKMIIIQNSDLNLIPYSFM